MRFFIIILTLVMTFKPVIPLVDYAINYDYISEVLCINKNKPELKCNGKCHLKNELAKANDDTSTQDKKNQNTVKRSLQTEYLDHQCFIFLIHKTKVDKSKLLPLLKLNYSYLFSKSIFHPPLV